MCRLRVGVEPHNRMCFSWLATVEKRKGSNSVQLALLGHFPHRRLVVVPASSFRELHIGTTPVSPFKFISIDEWNQFARSLPIRPVGISEFLAKHFLLHPDPVEEDRDQK